jgi:uncharacterized protein YggE
MNYASVDASEFVPQPRPMMMKAQRANAEGAASPLQDFTPAKVTITAHVNVLFELN